MIGFGFRAQVLVPAAPTRRAQGQSWDSHVRNLRLLNHPHALNPKPPNHCDPSLQLAPTSGDLSSVNITYFGSLIGLLWDRWSPQSYKCWGAPSTAGDFGIACGLIRVQGLGFRVMALRFIELGAQAVVHGEEAA